jgi:glycosyltransferase involved in cell wall biosynthesis
VAPPDPLVVREEGAFLARSRAAADAVAAICGETLADLVEFQDFDGLGFWALSHRSELGLEAVPLAVRLHGPVDLMLEAMGGGAPELEPAAAMEREAFAMADLVIVPSAAMGSLAATRYGLEPNRIRIGTPPVPVLEPATPLPAAQPEFVAYGRLAEVKGSADFLQAALAVAATRDDARFRFIGPDGWSVAGQRPMREWLEEQIPDEFRERITFEPEVARERLGETLGSAWAVVIPSRYESFCLAAHEVRRLGFPLLVRDLPAFQGFFGPETGTVVYETEAELAAAMTELAADPDRLAGLASSPAPTLGDPLEPYRGPPPEPRHPRSQAGLATAAVTRVATAHRAAAPEAASGTSSRFAGAVVRALPGWGARLAVKVVPQGLKDRFRAAADWRVEAERRARQERRRSVEARIAAGAFPELADPEVTIVIPCFNQGAFVDDALMSVFEQTFTSFEVIIVDDGSTDPDTITHLDRLDWPRTRLVRQENRGLPGARNAGMRLAEGRFLVPLDADDEIAPEFLEVLRSALEERPDAAYAHCWSELYGDEEATWVARPFNPYLLALSNSVVGCVLMRTEAWKQVGGYDETMLHGNEDWDMWLRLLEAGWDQVQIRRSLFRYRRHGVSMSVTTEARFEAARAEVASRHPGLFTPEALRSLKAAWYPWVSVVLGDGDVELLGRQTFADVEVIPIQNAREELARLCGERKWPCRPPAADLAEAVRSAHGKFVITWDRIADAPDDALAILAATLEAAPEAAASGPGDDPVLWRRWALVDPGSGHEGTEPAALDMSLREPSRLKPGCCPLEEWTVDGAPSSRPVVRHEPEDAGAFPTWLREPA